ncbi:hypothetical protein [Gulosibacter molinativorax]|uniref:hypothetical protein n=1 Tax=Gulosibacter molinativorax TaxID=256821 RepID=UPI0012EC9B44|nr:hypothetical protein [Gulosibacter molinativorax]
MLFTKWSAIGVHNDPESFRSSANLNPATADEQAAENPLFHDHVHDVRENAQDEKPKSRPCHGLARKVEPIHVDLHPDRLALGCEHDDLGSVGNGERRDAKREPLQCEPQCAAADEADALPGQPGPHDREREDHNAPSLCTIASAMGD